MESRAGETADGNYTGCGGYDSRMNEISVTFAPVAGRAPALPERATAHAAGYDLRADLDGPLTLAPGGRTAVPTGWRMAIPPGYEAQVRPRSGLALKHGVTCLNTPGTIDADYRGEVKVILANLGAEPVTLQPGERIAQLVICALPAVRFVTAAELPETERGEGGFGSTGSK